MLKDIAVLTGGQGGDRRARHQARFYPQFKDLGKAKRLTIDKDNTTIIDGAGSSKDIKGRCESIRKQIETTTSEYDKEKLQERLAKLPRAASRSSRSAPTPRRR